MKTLTFGGWYQRTTLHLTEVYRFLSEAKSNLNLDYEKLKRFREQLDLKTVKRVSGYLEYIDIKTNSGINCRYYEDGLYVFELDSNNLETGSKKLKEYFEKKWKPAISYIFSLGAPTPKELSNIKDDHPIVIGDISTNPKNTKLDPKKYGKIYSETISKSAHVFKTNKCIVTVVSKRRDNELKSLIDMQIFFREFKIQLHKYLDIHRRIWEEIAEIKEKKKIKGKDADEYRSKLESYRKSIKLIENRINQMRAYAKTRASLSKTLGVEENLISHFEYKHEDLFNTLEYIKEIWKMTIDYVDSAIEIVKEVKTKTAVKGVKSIQLIASIGAMAGILRLMNPKMIPVIDTKVAILFISVFVLAIGMDWFLKWRANNKEYKLKFKERSKDL
jgi:hypothetical protein